MTPTATRVLLLLLLAGCAAPRSTRRSEPLVCFPLPQPSTFAGRLELEQWVEGHYDERTTTLHCHVTINPDLVQILGLTPLGTRGFLMRFDGRAMTVDNYTGRDLPFPPEMMVSDVQQTLWPELPESPGWKVKDAEPPWSVRKIFHHEQLITEIHYDAPPWETGKMYLTNHFYGYGLEIRNLNVWKSE